VELLSDLRSAAFLGTLFAGLAEGRKSGMRDDLNEEATPTTGGGGGGGGVDSTRKPIENKVIPLRPE